MHPSPIRRSRLSGWWGPAIALLVVLALLLALELALRVSLSMEGENLAHALLSPPPPAGEELRLIDLIRASASPRMIFELRPGAKGRFHGVEVSVNSEGLRDVEVSRSKPAGTTRIVLLGDSCAFGLAVAFSETLAERLEALLNRSFGGTGRRFEVLNFGVPAYNTAMEAEQFRTRGIHFDPDAVVLLYVGNDLELPNFVRAEADPWTLRKLLLVDLVRSRLVRFDASRATEPVDVGLATVPPRERLAVREAESLDWVPEAYRSMVGWPAVVKSLRDLAELGRARSIPMLILCHNPTVNQLLGQPAEAVRGLSSELYQTAAQAGWRVANPLELQVRYLQDTGLRHRVYWVKPPADPHPSPLLHAILALRVYQELVEAGVVPAGAVDPGLPLVEQVKLVQGA